MSTLKGLQTDHDADFRLIITGLCDLIDSPTAKKKDHTPKIGMKFEVIYDFLFLSKRRRASGVPLFYMKFGFFLLYMDGSAVAPPKTWVKKHTTTSSFPN